MLSVIMAGGEGTRLRPLTLSRPKPLVPVAGKSAMSRILELLTRSGVKDAAVTLRYLGNMIEKEYGEAYAGINLKYFYEDMPLGTAGSVRAVSSFLESDDDDSFLIISGDAVTEIDIGAAVDFHRRKNSDVTLILSREKEAGEYGVVECRAGGEIARFIEKPSPSQQFADTVNTGIYIMKKSLLNTIPADKPYDFGHDMFPALLKKGLPPR